MINSNLTNKIGKTLGRRGDRILCVLSFYIRVDIIALLQIPLYNNVVSYVIGILLLVM